MAPTLGYWDLRGLVMPIKYVLEYAGVEYEDKLYKQSEREVWQTDKANLQKNGLPLANLPYYIDGDVKLSQSLAILQYVAAKHNLAGNNAEESAIAAMVSCQLFDMRMAMAHLFYMNWNDENKATFLKETAPTHLQKLEQFMDGKDFVLGKTVSYADFFMWESLDHLLYFEPTIMDSYSNLKSFYDRVANLPKMKEYLASSKCIKFPLNGASAKWGGKMEDSKTRYPNGI